MRRHMGAGFIASVVLIVLSACATSEDQRNHFTPSHADDTLSLNSDDAYSERVSDADFAARRTEIWCEKAITVHPEQIFQPL
jgi:uncharacterized protein YcbX